MGREGQREVLQSEGNQCGVCQKTCRRRTQKQLQGLACREESRMERAPAEKLAENRAEATTMHPTLYDLTEGV